MDDDENNAWRMSFPLDAIRRYIYDACMAKNPHAQALGKLGGAATAAKPLTDRQKQARQRNLKRARESRWPKKREN